MLVSHDYCSLCSMKQKELREQTMEDYVHEASKPLARYKDDEDLDRIMQDLERDGDPMAMFLKKKKSKTEGTANGNYWSYIPA